MKAMVLAAGVGSRLDPLTAQLPKPLVPIANRPVMDHILQLLKKHDVTEIIANLHYMPTMIRDYYGDGSKHGVKLAFREEAELSGDAGGVRACRDFLDSGTFLVVMGDLITDCDLASMLQEHKSKGAIATLGVKRVPNVEQFGVVVQNEEGFIRGFQEKPKQSEALSDMASAGIYILEPEVFEHFPATGAFGFGRELFPMLVGKGAPVLGVDINCYWSDVGTIAQYRQSNLDVLEKRISLEIPGRHKKSNESSEVYLGDDATISSSARIEGKAIVGSGSKVGDNVVIEGSVVIGDDCTIEDGAVIVDSVIWSGTRVASGSEIRTSVIGMNSIIERNSKIVNKAIQGKEDRELSPC